MVAISGGSAINDGLGGQFIVSSDLITDDNINYIRPSGAGAQSLTLVRVSSGVGQSPTYAALRLRRGAYAGDSIFVSGRTTARDGGEGTFVWRTGSATDNGGTILAGPGGSGGYWERVTNGIFDPRWWGADPTYTIDSAAALNAACLAAQSSLQTTASTVFSGTIPTVMVPHGKYRIDSSVVVGSYIKFTSDNAQIVASGSFSVLKDIHYKTEVSGVRLIGGTRGIEIFNGLQPLTIKIRGVHFYEQTEGAIWGSELINACFLTIEGCEFYSTTGTGRKLIYLPTSDLVAIRNCEILSANGIFLGQSTIGSDSTNRVIYENNIFTPAPGLDSFFDNDALNLRIVGCRFGGEPGATSIVKQRAGILQSGESTSLVIENNALQSGTSPTVDFLSVPSTFKFKYNQGVVNQLKLESGCFANTDFARSRLQSWEVADNQIDDVRYEGAAADIMRCLNADRAPNEYHQSNVEAADYVMKIDVTETGSYGFTGSTSSIAVTTGLTNSYGSPAESYTGTSLTYAGTLGRQWVNALNGLPDGQYTAVFDVHVTSEAPVAVLFVAGGSDHNIVLRKGKHSVCVPFWFHSTGTAVPSPSALGCELVGWSLWPMNDTQIVEISTTRIFRGVLRTHPQHTEVLSVAPPSSGAWRPGDVAVAPIGAGWRYQSAGWSPTGATVFCARSVDLLTAGQTELIPVTSGVKAMTIGVYVRIRSRTGAVTSNATIRAGNNGTYDNVSSSWLVATSTVDDTESLLCLAGAVDLSTAVSFSVLTAAAGPSVYTADVFWHGILI